MEPQAIAEKLFDTIIGSKTIEQRRAAASEISADINANWAAIRDLHLEYVDEDETPIEDIERIRDSESLDADDLLKYLNLLIGYACEDDQFFDESGFGGPEKLDMFFEDSKLLQDPNSSDSQDFTGIEIPKNFNRLINAAHKAYDVWEPFENLLDEFFRSFFDQIAKQRYGTEFRLVSNPKIPISIVKAMHWLIRS